MSENNEGLATGGAGEAPRPLNSVAALVAGNFAGRVTAIWRGEREREYLTASDLRRHIWHAWLASPRLGATPWTEAAADNAYRELTRCRGKRLLAEAYGCCPPGLVGALGRLGAMARREEFYCALVCLLARGGAAAKIVRHDRDLSEDLVVALATLPEGCDFGLHPMRLAAREQFGPRSIVAFAWAISRMRQLHGGVAVEAIMRASNPWAKLQEALFARAFPPPPWPGGPHLAPLDSPARLREAAARFRNCMSNADTQTHYLRRIVSGAAYLYEWSGEEPALIELRRILHLGWRVVEASGPHNEPVSEGTNRAVAAQFASFEDVAPVIPARSAIRVYDDEHFFQALEY